MEGGKESIGITPFGGVVGAAVRPPRSAVRSVTVECIVDRARVGVSRTRPGGGRGRACAQERLHLKIVIFCALMLLVNLNQLLFLR